MTSKLVRITGSISPNSPEMRVTEHEVTKTEKGDVYAKEQPHHASSSYRVALDKLGEAYSESSPGWFRYIIWLLDPTEQEIALAQMNILMKLSGNVEQYVKTGKKFEADLLRLFKECPKGLEEQKNG